MLDKININNINNYIYIILILMVYVIVYIISKYYIYIISCYIYYILYSTNHNSSIINFILSCNYYLFINSIYIFNIYITIFKTNIIY